MQSVCADSVTAAGSSTQYTEYCDFVYVILSEVSALESQNLPYIIYKVSRKVWFGNVGIDKAGSLIKIQTEESHCMIKND